MSSYTLFWGKGSGAFPVAVMLEAAGVAFEEREVYFSDDKLTNAELQAVNPRGQVPALVLPDGQVMTESAAICLYLGDRHSESGLLPAMEEPARVAIQRWLVFAATQLYEDILRIYYTDRYTTDPKGIEGVKASAVAALDAHAGLVQEAMQGRPFFLGDRMTILDVYLAAIATWHPRRGQDGQRFAIFKELAEAVSADPRVASIWARYEMDRV
ncbi:MAG: glutathione S-transferase family protein [Pseudomonadota bacterium]